MAALLFALLRPFMELRVFVEVEGRNRMKGVSVKSVCAGILNTKNHGFPCSLYKDDRHKLEKSVAVD